jgi:hypothetical protein
MSPFPLTLFRSTVLLHRMSIREPGFMPPLATNVVDKDEVKMMEEWIKQLLPNIYERSDGFLFFPVEQGRIHGVPVSVVQETP